MQNNKSQNNQVDLSISDSQIIKIIENNLEKIKPEEQSNLNRNYNYINNRLENNFSVSNIRVSQNFQNENFINKYNDRNALDNNSFTIHNKTMNVINPYNNELKQNYFSNLKACENKNFCQTVKLNSLNLINSGRIEKTNNEINGNLNLLSNKRNKLPSSNHDNLSSKDDNYYYNLDINSKSNYNKISNNNNLDIEEKKEIINKNLEINFSDKDLEMIEMFIKDDQDENDNQFHNKHNDSNVVYNINQINDSDKLMDIEDLPRLMNSDIAHNDRNININSNVHIDISNQNNEKKQKLKKKREFENERNLLIHLEPELNQMNIDEFDKRFNIAYSIIGQMKPEINSYFFVVKVFEDVHNRKKTIFCINCLEKSFYFNLINKKYPKDDNNNPIIIDYNSFDSILSFYNCYKIELQENWSKIILESKDMVFVNSNLYQIAEKKYIINLKGNKNKLENFIVLEPEFMLTPTEIRSALNCIRKEHFSHDHFYPSNDKDNRNSMIIGNIVHKILEGILFDYKKFQEIKKTYSFNNLELSVYNYDPDSFTNLNKLYNRIEQKFYDVLPELALGIVVLLGKTYEEIFKEVEPYFIPIQQFVFNFVVNNQKIYTRNLDEIKGIEIPLSSQVLGIKGNIDILCTTKSKQQGLLKINKLLKEPNNPNNGNNNSNRIQNDFQYEILTPIELKTGNRLTQNIPDKFQVLMYFLLIMEQMKHSNYLDEAPFAMGLLVYLKMQEDANRVKKPVNYKELMYEINFLRIDFVNLMVKRNLLAKSKIKNLKIDPEDKEKFVDIPLTLYSEDSKGSDNPVCNKCFVKDTCYKIHLNIENPQLKNSVKKIIDERKEHVEFNKTMNKILIEYEEENQIAQNKNITLENNKKTFNYKNSNSVLREEEKVEVEELDDFDYENSKQKNNLTSLTIRNDFINENLVIDSDYIEYFKFQQKLIKNTEVHKYLVEDSLTANDSRQIDYKKYQVDRIESNSHHYCFFIWVPKECLKYLFMKKQLTSLQNKEDIDEIQIEKFKNENSSRLLAKKITLYDQVGEDYECFYPGILEKILEYDSKSKQLLIEISVLKHYIDEKRIGNPKYPFNYIWLKSILALGAGLVKNFKGNIYEITFNKKYEKLRRTIIKNEKPIFIQDESYLEKLSNVLNEKAINRDYSLLNVNQKEALMKILLANDYCTIEGYPGTGKTFLLVLAIRILRRLGKKILISSFTNCALDNILMRLKEKNIKFHRVGNDYKIHEEIKIDDNCYIHENSFKSIDDWNKFYNEVEIIGCTSIGANAQMLWNMRFDYCFVDEAGQLDEYNILGPIMLADKFVLIGDTHQLPPLSLVDVDYKPETLFKRLIRSHPEANIKLNIQYRMNEQIQSLSNHIVYNNALKCANDIVKFRKLRINLSLIQEKLQKESLNIFNAIDHNYINCMMRMWNPELPVVFLNYNSNNYDEQECNFANNINSFEAKLVLQLVEAILNANYDPKEIGILTPFLNQEFFLRKTLELFNIKDNIITIDKSQGSEKDIIIISFCLNSNEGIKILTSIERLNVAFTRAKKKIICIGNFENLKKLEVLKEFLILIENNNWILNYPVIVDKEKNDKIYCFN